MFEILGLPSVEEN